MEFYYKTTNGKCYELFPKDIITLSNMKIFEAKIPECTKLYIDNNQLKELILPQSCEVVNCSNNRLKKLELSNNIVELNCSNNQLKELYLPKSCINISCYINKLSKLIISADCINYLHSSNNKLTYIDLPNKIRSYLYLDNNLLKYIVFPKDILKLISKKPVPFNTIALHNNSFPLAIKNLFESKDTIKMTLASNLCKANIKIKKSEI